MMYKCPNIPNVMLTGMGLPCMESEGGSVLRRGRFPVCSSVSRDGAGGAV